jgi:glycosyltransferase involved in cell wall biosynthesis
MKVSKKIVFLIPRFHTNLEPIVSEFVNNGYKIQIFPWNSSIAEIRNASVDLSFCDNALKAKIKVFRFEFSHFRFWHMTKKLKKIKESSHSLKIYLRGELSFFGIISTALILFAGMRNQTTIYTQYPKKSKSIHHKTWKFLIVNLLGIRYFTQVYSFPDESITIFKDLSIYREYIDKRLLRNIDYIPFSIPRIVNISKQNFTKKDIISVGKAEPRKGFTELIEVFNRNSDRFLESHKLILVLQVLNSKHQNYLNSIIEESKDLIDEKKIEFHINLSTQQTRDKINEAAILILNSVNEPASFVQWESISIGTPVIMNRSNGSSDLLPQDYGILKVSTIIQLEDAVVKMIKEISLQEQRVVDLKNVLVNYLEPNQIMKKWIEISELNSRKFRCTGLKVR